MADDPFITIGKIGAAYGLKGWLKVYSYTARIDHIVKYSPWYLLENHHPREIQIEAYQIQGKKLLIKFPNIENPEHARLLTDKLIVIKRSQLPPLKQNEYYWSDLIGLSVVDRRHNVLGKVNYLIETGSNDVLVIQDQQKKEFAIPYLLNSVILSIDLENQIIQVNEDMI